MITSNEDKTLSSERYDAKLFRQAYKAGLKAKELDKQRKKLLKIKTCILVVFAIVAIVISIFLFKPKPKPNYISMLDVGKVYSKNLDIPNLNDLEIKRIKDLNISAKSAVLYNANSSKEYFNKNTKEVLNIASLTKLITAMVLIDTYGLEKEIEITKDIPEDIGWSIGLKKGDIISSEQLLNAMLITSYNDAAYIAANEYEGGYEKYIELMNEKIQLIGCNDTNLVNPVGFDAENHYSTTDDLKKIVNVVLKYPSILEITDKLGEEIVWISEGEIKKEYIYTTNQLLSINPYIKGLKTGYTEDAGQCLITLYENELEKYVIILLGSENRFVETKTILNSIAD